MRLPFPERIPINRAAIFAVVLFAVQRIEGTPLYFCVGCLVFILIATLAFNTAGGLTRASGAYVFFYAMLVVIVGLCYKAFLGEPADSNLADPRGDIKIYVGGISAMFAAVIVSRRFAAKTGALENILKDSVMYRASIGCMVVGYFGATMLAFLGTGAVSLQTAFGQFNQLMPLGILIGVMHEIRSSGGRRSMNLPIALSIGYFFFTFGIMSFSKQGLLLPFYCWLLPVCALRYRLSAAQIGIIGLGGFLMFHYLTPYAEYGRGLVHIDTTAEQRRAIVEDLITHPERTRQIADAGGADQPRGLNSYYDTPQGLWERLQFISADDVLNDFTDRTGARFGMWPIIASIYNAVPHFIWPNKPIVDFGDQYINEIQGRPLDEDFGVGISFSPTAEAYHMEGWFGIFLVAPIVWLAFFIVMDTLLGDLRTPWGLLLLAMISHAAPEGGMTGLIYLLTLGVEIVTFCALFATYVAPIVATIALGPDRNKKLCLQPSPQQLR